MMSNTAQNGVAVAALRLKIEGETELEQSAKKLIITFCGYLLLD